MGNLFGKKKVLPAPEKLVNSTESQPSLTPSTYSAVASENRERDGRKKRSPKKKRSKKRSLKKKRT